MSQGALHIVMVSRRVHPAHGPGGMERKVFDLVTRLPAAGVSVELFAETPRHIARATEASAVMPEGAVIHWVPGRWLPIGDRTGTVVLDRITNYPLWTRRVARWMQRTRDAAPTAVHAHGLAAWGFVGVDCGAPLVMSVEGLEEFETRGLKRWAYAPFRRHMRSAAAAADVVIATDRALQPAVERNLGIPVARQAMIPNAVDAEACRRLAERDRGVQALASMGLAARAPLFLSAGRLEANKGFAVLVDALARASASLPRAWAWVLIGDGPQRAALEAAVARAGIGAHVRLTGRVSEVDLHSLAEVADWFVHPTLFEGSSIVTLEAMAHGLPVVASAAGGLPDKVQDGTNGLLVPPGDAAALAGALLRAVSADARAMGDAGRRRVDSDFDWNVIIDRYVEVYRRAAVRQAGKASLPNAR